MVNDFACCEALKRAIQDPDVPLLWTEKFRELTLQILDGGDSGIVVTYCPWSGHKLPVSLRAEWFATLEQLDIDPYGSDIPADYLSSAWYNNR